MLFSEIIFCMGICLGGGVALLYASRDLDKIPTANFDQKVGVQIIQNALKVPFTPPEPLLICKNSAVKVTCFWQDLEIWYNFEVAAHEMPRRIISSLKPLECFLVFVH
jgi:hypothetical protein